jgi:hypothetical protein
VLANCVLAKKDATKYLLASIVLAAGEMVAGAGDMVASAG